MGAFPYLKENKMAPQHYSSKIDWWIIAVLAAIFIFVVSALLWVGIEWYVVLTIGAVLLGFIGLSCTEVRYVIDDDNLGVRSYIKWEWYPIENIKEVRKVTSLLAAPAMSFTRVKIKFQRGTTKLAYPLEISPKDRDVFIQDLLKINPNIKVIH